MTIPSKTANEWGQDTTNPLLVRLDDHLAEVSVKNKHIASLIEDHKALQENTRQPGEVRNISGVGGKK